MNFNDDQIFNLLKENIENINLNRFEESGIVYSYYDNICMAKGLYNAFFLEEVIFDSGNRGIIFDLGNEYCYIFVLYNINISAGEGIKRTNNIFSINISDEYLGRVIDSTGNPIDNIKKINHLDKTLYPIETTIKGIAERVSVSKPLETGILLIDSIIPIGKGQRQLFIGNRNTGKTTSAVNIILNQKNKDVICIYVAIAGQESNIVKIRNYLRLNGALKNTIIISASSSKFAIHHYLAPYVGATIAEYFAHKKNKDVLIIYDDLSNNAIAYREMSLLMKRSPGREAYPGDVFYLHSRLLERAGNFTNGSSITAIPIAQLQEDDISAYIPTNLISITDGQVFFDTKLFNSGIKPAINTELSVSRVGGAAQTKNINKLSKSLRLNLAQYHELSIFSQFSNDLDDESLERLKQGQILCGIFKQDLKVIYTLADEIIILFLYKNWYSSLKKFENINDFINWILNFIKATSMDLYCNLNIYDFLLDDYSIRILNEVILNAINIFSIK